MKNQRGMTFISTMILIVLGISIVLLGVKLTPSYIEFFSVKKIMSAIAKDPAFPGMSVTDIRNSFDRRATIDYVDSVNGKDLDITKEDGRYVASLEYSKKLPLVLNISACLDFEASTADTK